MIENNYFLHNDSMVSEMGGKVMNTETTGHNYGFSLRGTIEGTAISFSEEFKKIDPQVTGFYVFESEVDIFHPLSIKKHIFVAEKFGGSYESDGPQDELGRF